MKDSEHITHSVSIILLKIMKYDYLVLGLKIKKGSVSLMVYNALLWV